MPFRTARNNGSSRVRVAKAEKGITDPIYEAEVDAIATKYRTALNQLVSVVQEAQRGVAAGDLTALEVAITEGVVRELQDAIRTISNTTARTVFAQALRNLRDLPTAVTARLRFDGKDPRAIEWARTQAGKMIVQITEETRYIVRQYIIQSLSEGVPVNATAQRIARVIGLHDRWATAVDNFYERELERNLRNGLSSPSATARASEQAVKYRKRLVRSRALNIARTEVAMAQNYGTYLGWLQAGDQGLLNLRTGKKEWVAGPSGWRGITVCDICAPMNGVQVGVNAMFPNGYIMPPAHPNCRCRMIYVPAEPPQGRR